eukprot:TRINITY_DN32650_c0_g1_i4.p2 TRINITY_DN32650_c0_g1~~TRINITY_DN32650_c0_g1_i4.p2  ORF type:complete len:226 (-),score=-11.04 TRINITY_DN32650_c0_g1_i4:346-1023(-)
MSKKFFWVYDNVRYVYVRVKAINCTQQILEKFFSFQFIQISLSGEQKVSVSWEKFWRNFAKLGVCSPTCNNIHKSVQSNKLYNIRVLYRQNGYTKMNIPKLVWVKIYQKFFNILRKIHRHMFVYMYVMYINRGEFSPLKFFPNIIFISSSIDKLAALYSFELATDTDLKVNQKFGPNCCELFQIWLQQFHFGKVLSRLATAFHYFVQVYPCNSIQRTRMVLSVSV